jgi:hypothetical protein
MANAKNILPLKEEFLPETYVLYHYSQAKPGYSDIKHNRIG